MQLISSKKVKGTCYPRVKNFVIFEKLLIMYQLSLVSFRVCLLTLDLFCYVFVDNLFLFLDL